MNKRRPQRRKEVHIQLGEDDPSQPFQTTLSAEVSKFSTQPATDSPWGKLGLAEIQLNGDRHFRPERLPSSRKERPKSARLTSMYYQNLDYVYNVAESLQVLELSNTGLFAFPQELAERLHNIETLILDHNSLTNDGFPACFKDLVSLTYLSVRRNKLTSIPSSWSVLFQMQTLYADSNEIGSLKHLDRLGKLQILSLENNRIKEIPRDFYSLKKLEYLNLSHNEISTVTVDVKRWINLKELDLSHNNLTFLIPDLFLLPKLEGLQLSHNDVAKIPTVSLKTKDKRRIHSVDISFNCLTRFPENVFAVTTNLDLSSNSIKVINNSAFKRLEWKTTKELNVQNNPLNTPPREVCEAGLKSMLHHYYETKVDSKIYQGIKIFMLGCQGSGKSSLVQSFLDQQARLTSEEDETVAIEIYDYQIDTSDDLVDPKPLSLSIWDCSGNEAYLQYIYPFLHVPCLALILFDLVEYKTENFQELIGQWIDTLILRNNRAVFILIGTKADRCKKDVKASEVLEVAQRDTENYIKAYLDSIDHEIACIERLDQISAAFNEQYRQYLSLKNFKPLFHPEALITSSSEMQGFDRLEAVLRDLATQTKTFPAVMRVIPALWGDVDNYLDDFGQNQIIISFKDLETIIHKRFGLRHLTNQICQYMHESGKVIFCEKEASFKDNIVLRPSSLFEYTRLVFRHDLVTFLMDPSDKEEIRERFLKTHTTLEYRAAVELATEHGILTLNLIKTLWGTGKRRFMLVNYLCDSLQWCYRIGKEKPRDQPGSTPRFELNFDIERKEDGTIKTDTYKVNLLVPSLVKCTEPEEAEKQWRTVRLKVCAAFRFTRFVPYMFFEKLLVGLHTEHLRYRYHWRNGVIAFHTDNPFAWLRVSLEDPEDKSYLVVLTGGTITSDSFDYCKVSSKAEDSNAAEAADAGEEIDAEEAEPEPNEKEPEETVAEDSDDNSADENADEPLEDEVFEKEENLKNQLGQVWKCLLPALLEAEKVLKQYPAAWFRREVQCPVCHEFTFWGEWLSPKETQELETRSCRACHAEVLTCLLVQPRISKKSAHVRGVQHRRPEEPSATDVPQVAESHDGGHVVTEVAAGAETATPKFPKKAERRKSVTFL